MDPDRLWTTFVTPWTGGDPDVIDALADPALVWHVPPFADLDLAGLKEFAAGFALAFPDFEITVDDVVTAEDRIVHLWHCSATFAGASPLLPMPPTGRRTHGSGTIVAALDGDRVVEVWHHGDWLGWLEGAGVIAGLGTAAPH